MSAQTSQGSVKQAFDRRNEMRYEGGVDGSFTLSSRKDPATGAVQVFGCRIDSLSASAISITAATRGQVGEHLWVQVEGFGILRGEIVRLTDDGFVMTLVGGEEQRKKLNAWVIWLRRRGGRASGDQREHMRTMPRDPRTTLTMSDGKVMRGLVSNISRSGAAISADVTPAPGTDLVVGKVPAKVVRHLEIGFAVEFGELLEAADADALVTGFEPAN